VGYYTYLFDVKKPGAGGSRMSYKPDAASLGVIDNGWIVGWDTDTKTLVKFVRDGAGNVKYVGVAADSLVGIRTLGNNPALDPDMCSVFTSGVHALLGTSAETYVHGTEVYMDNVGTNAERITTAVGTGGIKVGSVWLPNGGSLTGAVRVPVLIDNYVDALYAGR
jgi:hypothetical protein